MRYISWNCRGLGSNQKEEALKDIIRINKPDVLLVQETKMEESILYQVGQAICKKGPAIAISSKGASGGIATFWDSTKFDLIKEEHSDHWILTNLLHRDSGH